MHPTVSPHKTADAMTEFPQGAALALDDAGVVQFFRADLVTLGCVLDWPILKPGVLT
jgi:hypothetical protein